LNLDPLLLFGATLYTQVERSSLTLVHKEGTEPKSSKSSPFQGGFRGIKAIGRVIKEMCVHSSLLWEKGLGDDGKFAKLGYSQSLHVGTKGVAEFGSDFVGAISCGCPQLFIQGGHYFASPIKVKAAQLSGSG